MNKDQLAINTLKVNGAAAINKANSGHPGIVLGAAPIMHTLFSKHLVFDPKNPKWINRDRFILSAGHGSALLYAQLRLLGLIEQKDLEQFRQLESLTPGHPEYKHTTGVESTTGPLGQGIATAVGVALGQAHLESKFTELDHYTYVLCGDGDLEEGVAMEAMSFAGHQQLNKLIVLHDSNDIQLDTEVNKVFTENLKLRMEAIHWNYIKVSQPTVEAIDLALENAKKSSKPTFIEVKTTIGADAPGAGTSAVHGAPLGKGFDKLKSNIGWKLGDFAVPKQVKDLYEETIFARGAEAFKNFKASKGLEKFLTEESISIDVKINKNVATRVSSGDVIQHLNKNVQQWIGGSADLVASTKAGGADGDFSPQNRQGRNILFGVREFAMAAIANGLAIHSNFKPFVSTFFVFSDYLKPALRLAALMGLPVTYVFTHDSIFVGEDGPTHEPIEHLAMFRSMPNVNVFRPADEKEVIGAYEEALNSKDTPSVIVLTRQDIVSLKETKKEEVQNGSYKVLEGNNEWTLVASGSELANAVKIGKELGLSVVSLVNTRTAEVNWDTQKAISIEAATTWGLAKYAKYNIGIDQFGYSGDGNKIYEKLGLDYNNLKTNIKKIINN